MPRLMNPKPKPNTQRVTFHLPTEKLKILEKMADHTGRNVSQIIREAIDKYMNVEQYRDDTEFITGIVRPIIKDEIGKQANRLASMLFKVGIITSSNYFLAVRTLSDVISPSMQEDFKNINASARKQGIEYMKLNGVGVVEFLEDKEAVERAAEKLKTDYTVGN
ncbi:MAG: ribbon-helix-helix domain-containing protein [Oscillospiraceae bacterium]|nr:ribbon-helix-helix domain-containing protein [Oscillospiraceae bacterium]